LGPYQVLEEIGRGGMGVVFKAVQPALKRTVALKVLIAGEDASEEAIKRFHREAEAVAKLGHHPNIVPVHDIGQEGKLHYFALHYVEGKPLDRMIDDGEIAPKRAALMAMKLADALQHAHDQGIMHRDIKPSNILVSREGEPQISDFGLARDVQSDSRMTRSGMTLGTPAYMAPEQADGRIEDIDTRSDVYSLGATLYEMITFQPPFEGAMILNVIKKVLMDEPVPPRKFNRLVEKDLETICLKCLEKDPAKRYPSARELARDLQRYLEGEPILAVPAGPVTRVWRKIKRNRGASVGIAATCLSVGALTLVLFGPGTLAVETDPSGAEIFVNGRHTGFKAPVASKWIWPPGKILVRAELAGHDPAEREVSVGALSGRRVTLPLVKDHGFLRLDVDPIQVTVAFEIQGKAIPGSRFRITEREAGDSAPVSVPDPAGSSVPGLFRLPKGTHRIRISAPDYETFSDAVFIAPGKWVGLSARLVRHTGLLTVTCAVDNVTMKGFPLPSIAQGPDGKPSQGATPGSEPALQFMIPAESLRIPAGRWRMVFEKENHFPDERVIDIRKGANAQINATVQPMLHWAFETGARIESSTAVADLDGNGSLEVVATSMDGWVYVLEGAEGKVHWRYRMGSKIPCSPAVGDLEGNGSREVVVASQDRLVVLDCVTKECLWETPLLEPAGTTRPCLADLDGDGALDIVLGLAKGSLHAYSFRERREIWKTVLAKGVFSALALAELDGDGCSDLFAIGRGTFLYAISGSKGRELWKVPIPARSGEIGSPAVGEFDGDGVTDVVIGTREGKVLCISGSSGKPIWTFQTERHVHSTAEIVDLTGDGIPEVVTGSGDNRIYAIDGGKGTLLWAFETAFEVWTHVSSCEITGDGIPDIFAGSDDFHVYALDGRDGSLLWRFKTGNQVISAIEIADLDGNGIPEAVFTSKDWRVYAVRTKPDPGVHWIFRTQGAVTVTLGGDIDGDGTPEVHAASSDYHVYTLSGRRGDLLWKWKTQGGILVEPESVSDIDGDTFPDLIIRSADTDLRAISGRKGTVIWNRRIPSESTFHVFGDIDGDGFPDIFLDSKDATLFTLSGRDGRLLWQVKAKGPVHAALGFDIDHDRVPDILTWFALEPSAVEVVSGRTGQPLWTSAVKELCGAIPCGDLDGDGLEDMVAKTSGEFVYALSGREGSVLWRSRTGAGMKVAAAGDLNGDGIPDTFTATDESRLHAVSGKDGSFLWSVPCSMGSNFLLWSSSDLEGDGIRDVILALEGGAVRGFSGATGTLFWETRTEDILTTFCSAPPGGERGAPNAFLGSFDNRVYALSARRQKPLGILWSFSKGRQEERRGAKVRPKGEKENEGK
jgi:outer membrane protein assembly factor BamB